MQASAAYIAIGSNLGDRRATLSAAVKMLGETPGVQVRRVSELIETEPVGLAAEATADTAEGGCATKAGQGKYLNGAAEIQTTLSPQELLGALQEIERQLGRDRAREERWGPRTCDLDILLFGDAVIDTPRLTVPHPRMHERRFVLEPLAEIAPEAIHPVLGKSVAQLLADLEQHRIP